MRRVELIFHKNRSKDAIAQHVFPYIGEKPMIAFIVLVGIIVNTLESWSILMACVLGNLWVVRNID